MNDRDEAELLAMAAAIKSEETPDRRRWKVADACEHYILALRSERERRTELEVAIHAADLHCDLLGYLEGDYDESGVDGEGIALASRLRSLLPSPQTPDSTEGGA